MCERTAEDVFKAFEPSLTVVHAQVVEVDGMVLEFEPFLLALEECDAQQSPARLLPHGASPLHLHSKHILQLHILLLLPHTTVS